MCLMKQELLLPDNSLWQCHHKHIPVVSGDKELVIHFAVTALLVLEQQCAVVEGCQLREAEVKVFHKTLERWIWTKSRQVRASTTGHYVTGGIQS